MLNPTIPIPPKMSSLNSDIVCCLTATGKWMFICFAGSRKHRPSWRRESDRQSTPYCRQPTADARRIQADWSASVVEAVVCGQTRWSNGKAFSTRRRRCTSPRVGYIFHFIISSGLSGSSWLSLLSIQLVWYHLTCPTNFNKSLKRSPDSVWGHRVRQRSSYHLLEGRHWVTERFLSLPPGHGRWNSLPSTVTAASTLHSFRRALKTHLFTASFPPS